MRELEGLALQRGTSLYRAAVQSGRVQEATLVGHLAAALAVPSVSLENFTAKKMLVDLLPADVVRRHRVLPVGLKPRDGELTLFVAMEDPQDLDALEAVSVRCPYPLVPLLAGPLDLDGAVRRVYPDAIKAAGSAAPAGASTAPAAGTVAGSARSAARDRHERSVHPDLFGSVLDDLEQAQPSEMLSALSLLDDIPRNRHEQVTSPTGFSPIDDQPTDTHAAVETRSAAPPSAEQRPRRGVEPSRPAESVRGFTRRGAPSESAVPAAGWESRPPDVLVRAVVSILLRRGVITRSELDDALNER
ncbi:MAG: hypothetical protein H6700_11945 [Myxococcales bacterium]|nr:hypothetical protein [Myxococcales bacterium]